MRSTLDCWWRFVQWCCVHNAFSMQKATHRNSAQNRENVWAEHRLYGTERLRIVWMINENIYHTTMATVYRTEPDKLGSVCVQIELPATIIPSTIRRNRNKSWPIEPYTISQLTWLIFRWCKSDREHGGQYKPLSVRWLINGFQMCPKIFRKMSGTRKLTKKRTTKQQEKNHFGQNDDSIATLAKMTHDDTRLYRPAVINHGFCA